MYFGEFISKFLRGKMTQQVGQYRWLEIFLNKNRIFVVNFIHVKESPTFSSAFSGLQILIHDFSASESHFLSPQYSEAEVRKDFIDKFFTLLGWEVDHVAQK